MRLLAPFLVLLGILAIVAAISLLLFLMLAVRLFNPPASEPPKDRD